MSRRDLLIGAGATVLVAAPDLATVGEAKEHDGHGSLPQGLIDAALACEKAGEACLAHCLAMFRGGDTQLAACATNVQQMLAVCEATSQLASYGSPRLPAFVRVCADICADCEAECRKHEKEHAICKACADACARFVTEARAIATAA